jgi:hypothetical protein
MSRDDIGASGADVIRRVGAAPSCSGCGREEPGE